MENIGSTASACHGRAIPPSAAAAGVVASAAAMGVIGAAGAPGVRESGERLHSFEARVGSHVLLLELLSLSIMLIIIM